MHLSGLELHGFKSFPKKTKLTFTPGVMGIVGPNGCGKTNIVDAVRWVLGEQRTSVLRSDKMENVIFAGSGAQKPMQFAEITLIIENSHDILPAEYTEVAITRRLHRSGESEYLINRRPCRLKDIRNLFADTGLGPDSYSIIELKMVEDILSSRTDERRRLFEEAAGVTLYKQRLRAARHKLKATEADMVRLEDLLQEITSQRNSLKRQVAKTRRYRYLREAVRVKEIGAAHQEIADLRTRIRPLEERVERDRKAKEELEKELETHNEALSGLRGQVAALEEQLDRIGRQRSELEARQQSSQREMVMLQERLRSGLVRGEERDVEEKELAERRVQIARDIEEMDEKREKAKEREEEIRLRLQAMDDTFREFEERANEVRRVRDSREAARREAENRLARLESELAQLQRRREAVGQRLVQLQMEQRESGDLPDPEPIRAETESLAATLAAEEERIAEARDRREQHREERATAEQDASRGRADVQAATRRVKLLEGMVSGGEGRPKAVKALLTSGLDDLAGRLGDAVVVDDEWKLAVAAALEDVSSAVVAGSVEAVKRAADYLREGDRGRGLLALEEAPGAQSGEPSFADGDDILGPLLDRVKGKGRAGKAVQRLLKRVWIARDLDALLTRAVEAQEGGWTLVTPDGDRLTPDGLLAVGRTDTEDLGAMQLLEEARGELDAAQKRVAAAEAAIEEQRRQEEEAKRMLDASTNRRGELRQNLDEARNRLARVEADLRERETLDKRQAREREELTEEQQQLEARIEELEQELKATRRQVSEAEEAFEELLADLEAVEEEGRSLRSARDQLRDKQMEASSEVQRLEGEVRRHGSLLEEIARRLEKIKEERQDAAGAMEDAGERLRHVQGEEAVIGRELEQVLEELEKVQETYNAARSQFAERDGALSSKRSELSLLSDRLHAVELELSDLRHRRTSIRERIIEEYEIDLLTARQEELPLAVEEDNPYMDKPLGEIRDSLRNIGPVNQMALEEYEVIDSRYQELTRQHEDLTQAIETLEETIREINGIARKRFMETFTRVEGHFVSLFSRLFGGGEAALSLGEGDPLEAGIQIFASPKGKKLSSIELLSGGEKALTAIALLFSLYLERPSPFCFLDEVDAPLDDVNVVRFNRLLREFTDRTQFLVVTHNKLTMERADRLYGVTMEEEGISRMVAVEIGKKDREKVES